MSEETVEQVRRAYETFNRRDWDAFRRLMDRDVTVESRLVQMDGGYHGYDGLRRWWDEVFETIPDYRVEIEDMREVGDIVLVQSRGLGHGATSGTPVVDPFWHRAQRVTLARAPGCRRPCSSRPRASAQLPRPRGRCG